MQFSLRSLLISFAVAGAGAAVFCVWFAHSQLENDASAVACVVAVLLATTMFGQIRAQKHEGAERIGRWLIPPFLGIVVISFFVRMQIHERMAFNQTQVWNDCRIFAHAQDAFCRTDWNHDGVLEYAATFKELRQTLASAGSNAAIEQGLADAEWPSTRPYHGYYFKILTSQKLPIKRNFLDAKGRMTEGFALIAWPARYGCTGRDQLLLSSTGTLYAADYGSDPARHGENISECNPEAPYWVVEE